MTETKKTSARNTQAGSASEKDKEPVVLMSPHMPKGAYLVSLSPLGRSNRFPCTFADFSSVEAAEVAKAAILNADRARGGFLNEGDLVIVPR